MITRWRKRFILIGCLLLISGCAQNNVADRNNAPTKTPAQVEKQTKDELMNLMDKLMEHHDKNMSEQRQMINDYNKANEIGNNISQFYNKSSTIDQTQYNQLMSVLDKANNDLNTYKQSVRALLNEISSVENKANELKTEVTKARATIYLDGLQKATLSQVDYISNFQNLIDAFRQAYVAISQNKQPNTEQYDEYSKKEGELVDKFNKEIDEFNAAWKTLNEKDFNREVKENLSF